MRVDILPIVAAALTWSTIAVAQTAPCGEMSTCPSGLGEAAQRLQSAWLSGETTLEQKAQMTAFIQAAKIGVFVDWDKAAADYFSWRNGRPYSLQAGTPVSAPVHQPRKIDYREMRITAEEYIKTRLIDPTSAQFEWPNGFMDGWWKPIFQKRVTGYVTCGYVNARNRMGGYVGRTAFVVVINDGAVTYGQLGDATRNFDLLAGACAKTTFPPPQPEMLETIAASGSASVADELGKLASLRDRGILSAEEFESEKRRLLGR